jgi:hypothetical protein
MEAILETKAETILPRNTEAGSYFVVVGPRSIRCKFSLLERGQSGLEIASTRPRYPDGLGLLYLRRYRLRGLK